MMIDNNVKGFVKDLKFAFQFYAPSYSSQKFNAYECNDKAMIIVSENIEIYDMWSVYTKDLIRDNFESGKYESNVSKEYIESFLQVTKSITDYQKECIVAGEMPKQGLERILEITTKSKAQVAIQDGFFEVYSECLADPVKVYTEQALLDMLKAILILEKTYAGE